MYFGLFTDIFDGIIARKTGISSEKIRRLDSQTDLIFWLCIGFAAYLLNPELIKEHWGGIALIFIMEALCYIISLVKFGKETCTHAFLSKLWGLSLLFAFTGLIGFQQAGFFFYLAIVLGFVSHVDVILIVLFLPKWQHDVPSSYHAWRSEKEKILKEYLSERLKPKELYNFLNFANVNFYIMHKQTIKEVLENYKNSCITISPCMGGYVRFVQTGL